MLRYLSPNPLVRGGVDEVLFLKNAHLFSTLQFDNRNQFARPLYDYLLTHIRRGANIIE